MTETIGLFRPDWTLPGGVQAFVTSRHGGCSQPPRDSFNLGLQTGDDREAVAVNRRRLKRLLEDTSGLPVVEVQWLQQVHGTGVFRAATGPAEPPPEADACYGTADSLALAVLTADCLPVLFCSGDGKEIAVAHAGWRGLLGGVLEATVHAFSSPPASILAWLGPAIGPCHFEVGQEVLDAFVTAATAAEQSATQAAFLPAGNRGKWLADLYALARIRLQRPGPVVVSGEPVCTICNQDRFFSYRLQPVTGRFATLILKSG